MKKGTGYLVFLAFIAITVTFGYITLFGIGPEKDGSMERIKLGLDLAGGVSITYEAVGEETPTSEDISDTIYKLRKRIDKFSTEAQVYQEGDRRINIEIPGVSDANKVLQELGSPGSLYFIRATDPSGNLNYRNMLTGSGLQVYSDDGILICYMGNAAYLYDEMTDEIMLDEAGSPVPYEVEDQMATKPQYELTRSIDEIVADGSAIISGTDVVSAKGGGYTDDYNRTQYIVELVFSDEAAVKFGDATGAAAGKQGLYGTIAIYYDGELLSVPNVNSRIDGGRAQITNMRNFEEADRLAQSIRIGGLKVELQELRSNVVGAQLGTDAIKTSLMAGVIGLALVILLMIVVYRIPGLASSLALILYVILILLGINIFEVTLTLPGIAGIILSIGMAVDANVIVFARIKEEIRDGMTVQSAIKSGFSKAFSAIIDGNITTLISAIVLIAMGSGSLKGFAYTLAMGIVVSMFTALVITKMLLNSMYAIGFKDVKWYGAGKDGKAFEYVEKRKTFFGISGVVILVGIIMMFVNKASIGSVLNYSLDFVGGTATSVTFDTVPDREVVDGVIVAGLEDITNDANVSWQTVNDTNEIIFKTRALEVGEREALEQLLNTNFGISQDKIEMETISATVSGEMKREAIISVLVATLCMMIYIWFRFSDIRFGASAVTALLHDVMVVLTFYAVIRMSVGSTFIACMLTIVGYSINATIVIFDRVRENKRSMGRKETLNDVINKSVAQTLSRSIFTSLTTFIMIAVLYILGVSSIKEFALPLMVGILCGTYSSIFLAAPLWGLLRDKFPQTEEDDD